MHELSIATALIEQIEVALDREEGAGRASQVLVRVGTLSGVDEEALRMAFPVAAEGTRAADAVLEIETIVAEVHCRACEVDSSPDFPFFVCEKCGADDVEIISGRDLLLQSIEIESLSDLERTSSHV